ncbi:MAG: hypothetical protein HFI33_15455 [Lachnospiraceae bacterium]|nr:hypothetical protein [Lachnospiraceae bacterium]
MKRLTITWENIEDYSSIPIQYRFIDCAEVIPGSEAWGRKAVSSLDWFFKIHFPGNPVMPGVLVMETLQQTGLLIVTSLPDIDERAMLFHSCENMRMYHSVRPGDVLKTHVVLNSFKHGIANFHGDIKLERFGEEKELLACSMKFTMLLKGRGILRENRKTDETFRISEGERRVFDYSNIDRFLADPVEYRFIDYAEVSSSIGLGTKYSSFLDWYYKLCGLQMPAGFVMESIMQTGVLIVTQRDEIQNPLMMFNNCNKMSIFAEVRPGDVLKTHVVLESFRNGIAQYTGTAMVKDKKVCEMSFTLIHPDEIRKFSERLNERRIKNNDASGKEYCRHRY